MYVVFSVCQQVWWSDFTIKYQYHTTKEHGYYSLVYFPLILPPFKSMLNTLFWRVFCGKMGGNKLKGGNASVYKPKSAPYFSKYVTRVWLLISAADIDMQHFSVLLIPDFTRKKKLIPDFTWKKYQISPGRINTTFHQEELIPDFTRRN